MNDNTLQYVLLNLKDVSHTNDAFSPGWPRAARRDMCTADLFWGTRKGFNGFESQRAVFVSQTSGWRGERKGKRSWNLRQRGCWVLPVLAWRSHRGGFHSRWRRPGHYHLCPTPWWERCLFQFESGPLEERERERERAPRFMSKRSENFPLNTFAPALTWCWCIWPNYGILIFLVCFN